MQLNAQTNLILCFLLVSLVSVICTINNDDSKVNASGYKDVTEGSPQRILSRRKRFLIFPEGSSLQLVFCNSFPLIVLGNIFMYGYTAALAYELPQDPYSPFSHHADPLHRRMDTKTIVFTDEEGRVIHERPYQKKFIVNPAFAKRSVDSARPAEAEFKKGTDDFKIKRKQMHATKQKREFLKGEHMDVNGEFHRSNRMMLYRKIETLLKGLGSNGRQCMLKTLCLVGQTQNHPQGAFLQEILRAVFTLPKNKLNDNEDEDMEYDFAHGTNESCDDLFPDCNRIASPEEASVQYSYEL